MDVDTIKSLLADLDIDSYIAASLEKGTADEVWSKEIENTFIEAINLFARVGQRKYQIDPKPIRTRVIEFCGRNDIISRYIFMKTGKYRARKQVSSHIQVWVNCRKPPSSHALDMPRFTELQKVLRDHYTRASAESQGTPKRKVRRIASTSKVDALKKLGSACGRSSLGFGGSIGSQFIADAPSSACKHKLATTSEPPAKKLRRVVSEFPHSALDSIVNSGVTRSMVMDDTNIASSPTVFESMDHTVHIPKYSHLPQPHQLPSDFLSMVANPHFAAQHIPASENFFATDAGLSMSASPGAMSAFATAIRSNGYATGLDYPLEHDAKTKNGMMDMDSSFSEEEIQMFTEALKQYCNCIEEAGGVSTLPADIYYRHGSDPRLSPGLVIDENTSPCTRALVRSSLGNAHTTLNALDGEQISDSIMTSALKAHSDPALCPELPLAAIAGSVNFDSPAEALQAKTKVHKGQHDLPAEQKADFVSSKGEAVSEFTSQSLAPHMLQQDGTMASSMYPYTTSLDSQCSQDPAASWTGGIENIIGGHNIGPPFFDDGQSKNNVTDSEGSGKCSGGGSVVNGADTALGTDEDGIFEALWRYLDDAS
ncbi:hypothetical protein GGI15_001846 [Coemansia interrupta]|uniref:TEA domain-containing protein n=1 Tax=Coemansia interrupta TaxID=1126814 RepID=A0A9W8HIE8_9FUNG|nr:hypothetical protein GGI15_001846 [Coemansia interrupta]